MTLRTRLALATTALLVVTAVAFGGVALSQRQYLIGELDQRMGSLLASPAALVAAADGTGVGSRVAAGLLTDVYVGVQRADGTLVTVLAPDDDAALRPVLRGNEVGAGPVTRRTTSGDSPRVRLVATGLPEGRSVVMAVSLSPVEAATRRLLVSLGVAWGAIMVASALVAFWVDRLSLRPVARLTAAADEVTRTGGRATVQVDADSTTEAGRLGAAFNAMMAATSAAQERLRRFVSDAGHELRTPLTTLRGYSSLYQQGGLRTEDQVADAMGRINAESTRMARIVDDLLDLTTLGDASELTLGRVDLGSVAEDLAADLRVREPGRDVVVESGGEAVVSADSDRVRQALTALVANAVKYSPGGSPVTIGVEHIGDAVRVRVVDRGTGIPADELPKVFDRFYRVPGAERPGSGLGLAVVAAIMSAHGGRYGVESTAGRGSSFWIELPASDGRRTA